MSDEELLLLKDGTADWEKRDGVLHRILEIIDQNKLKTDDLAALAFAIWQGLTAQTGDLRYTHTVSSAPH